MSAAFLLVPMLITATAPPISPTACVVPRPRLIPFGSRSRFFWRNRYATRVMIRLIVLAFACFAITVYAVTPEQMADLSVTLTDSPDPVRQGDPLTYHLTVTNHGSDTARNARVVFFPVYGKFLSPLDAACRVVDINIECALSELAPGASTSYQWTVSAQGVRQTSVMSGISSDADSNDYNNARGQVTRVLYRIPKPEERVGKASTSKPGGQSCYRHIEVDGKTTEQRIQPMLTPMEINGIWVVGLPLGFQDQMSGTGPLHLGVLFTAIDQPGFPDWIKLKRAFFTQGEAQQELLLGQGQEACRPIRPHSIEMSEKLLCADPQQLRFNASHSIVMHLLLEDGQGRIYEIEDEFCAWVAS